jgi:hypothetical protein
LLDDVGHVNDASHAVSITCLYNASCWRAITTRCQQVQKRATPPSWMTSSAIRTTRRRTKKLARR